MSITKSKKRAIPDESNTKRKRRATKPLQPKASAKSRIRPIGNSKGVILSNQLIDAAGLDTEEDIVIQAEEGVIHILQLKTTDVNTDLSTWDKQFKTAIKRGEKPESDLFEGMANDFDQNEW